MRGRGAEDPIVQDRLLRSLSPAVVIRVIKQGLLAISLRPAIQSGCVLIVLWVVCILRCFPVFILQVDNENTHTHKRWR